MVSLFIQRVVEFVGCKHSWFEFGRYRECGKCGKSDFND